MTAPYVAAAVVGSWGLVFTLIGLATALTVLGLIVLIRSRRRPPRSSR